MHSQSLILCLLVAATATGAPIGGASEEGGCGLLSATYLPGIPQTFSCGVDSFVVANTNDVAFGVANSWLRLEVGTTVSEGCGPQAAFVPAGATLTVTVDAAGAPPNVCLATTGEVTVKFD